MEVFCKHFIEHVEGNPIGSWSEDTMVEAITRSAEATIGRRKPLREAQCLPHHRKELNRDHERLAAIRERTHKEEDGERRKRVGKH